MKDLNIFGLQYFAKKQCKTLSKVIPTADSNIKIQFTPKYEHQKYFSRCGNTGAISFYQFETKTTTFVLNI